MDKEFKDSIVYLHDEIKSAIKSRKPIYILTHNDCDGLVAASIIMKMLQRIGASCTVHAIDEFNEQQIAQLENEDRLYIITDLASDDISKIDSKLKDWFIIDHHKITEEQKDNSRVINSWRFGIDGSRDISAGGMSYLVASEIDDTNEDLAAIAVVSALGDRQDVGEKESLKGINQEIVKVAIKNNMLETKIELLLSGKGTLPLADALASTTKPMIDGLVWNKEACQTVFESAGITLKDKDRWRNPYELQEGEREKIKKELAKFVSNNDIIEQLEGYSYTLLQEMTNGPLYDAREYATLLSASGKIKGGGTGIAVCLGDRKDLFAEATKALQEYNKTIQDALHVLNNERWRTTKSNTLVIINAESVISENLTGMLSTTLANSYKNFKKIIILRTDGKEGTVKFSARKPIHCKSKINLQELFASGIKKIGGNGGGHDTAASARLLKEKTEEFVEHLDNYVAIYNKDSN